MRFDTSGRSYPELREIDAFWTRQRIRLCASSDWRMWVFLAVNFIVIVGANVGVALIGPAVWMGGGI